MGNSLGPNPWIIDTAANTVLTTQKLRIQKLRWVSEGASAGDNCVVQTAAGRVFWEAVALGIDTNIESDTFSGVAGDCQGLIVPTLGSGTLYLYYD